jgi:pyruvate kinase
MLNSMEHSSRPTRAEASDVFNAVIDGSDAVMLSGESAVGEYPIESVLTMRRLCSEAETYLKTGSAHAGLAASSLSDMLDPITEATVDAACLMTRQLDARLIVVGGESGRTALALSNRRSTAVVLAVVRTEQMARSLSLCWGVIPVVFADTSSSEQVLAFGIQWARSRRLVEAGQRAVLLREGIAGRPDVRSVLAGTID